MEREKPGGLQSVGSQRVRHNLVTKQQQHYMHKSDHVCCEFRLFFSVEIHVLVSIVLLPDN